MATQSHREPENLVFASLRDLVAPHSTARHLFAFCCFEVAYFFAYRYGMTFSQATASPFWFPDSVLLCAFLRTRPRWWLILLTGTIPIRLFSEVAAEVPLGLLAGTAINDYLKAVIVAVLLRRLMFDPVRFRNMRDFGVYCLIAVLVVPALSALAGAASRGPS